MTQRLDEIAERLDGAANRLLRVGDLRLPLEAQLELGEIYADICCASARLKETNDGRE